MPQAANQKLGLALLPRSAEQISDTYGFRWESPMNQSELTLRISRLEDLHAIRALSARYAYAVDIRDYQALAGMFSADALFGGTSDGASSISGNADIVAFLRDRLDAGGATYHSVHDALVKLDPDNSDAASGLVVAHAETRDGSRITIKAVRYQDDYRRIGGEWRFKRRMLSFPMDETAKA